MKVSMHSLRLVAFGCLTSLAVAERASAVFLDGEGYYSLQGATLTSPGNTSDRGMYQAIKQNFRLLGEARLNEKASVFLEFRLFDPRTGYFGDRGRPRRCNPGYSEVHPDDPAKRSYVRNDSCEDRPQDTGEPGYSEYIPRVTQIYARYAFEYCLLDVGRRGRDWGLGAFLSSGKGAFDQDASVFDGATCNINLQKAQTLAFSVGVDKLTETGTYLNNPYNLPPPPQPNGNKNDDAKKEADQFASRKERFGPTKQSDDLEQYFLTIEFDDRKANAGAPFTKDIGFYFSNIVGQDGRTDIKFLDLYTGFFLSNLAFRNEVIFRLGKSADPNWVRAGGRYDPDSDDAGLNGTNKLNTNNLQSIGFAGLIDWTMSRSGSYIGPAEYNKGDAVRHGLIFDYTYAPGDSDGYKSANRVVDARNTNATAMSFHRNYKPALILFNGHSELDDQHVDGIYDPERVMNAFLYGLAYRYESIATGNFEVKFITGTLDQKAPNEITEDYRKAEELYSAQKTGEDAYRDIRSRVASTSPGDGNRPAGFNGRQLGYELDLKYTKSIGKELDLGLAGAILLPGKGLQTTKDNNAANNILLQSSVAFKF